MKISVAILIAACTLAANPAAARNADAFSFFHPNGFWGNPYIVPQQRVYLPFHRVPHAVSPFDPCCGGGVMHERNW